MKHYSILWEKVRRRPQRNFIEVKVTLLAEGRCHSIVKYYEEWIGVCTESIDSVVRSIQTHFPGTRVRYQQIGLTKKVLPYFKERLEKGKLDYRSKPFYKVYATAPHNSIGLFLNRRKIGYFDPEDWLVRIYIDFCTLYDTRSFYYRWYSLREDSQYLLDALQMHLEMKEQQQPDWTVAAFDLEVVPMEGNHVPKGHVSTDKIVMASVVKWKGGAVLRRDLLYVLPDSLDEPLPGYPDAFRTESEMLERLHALLEDAQVITGYNIDEFDFPCLFARLFWLEMHPLLRRYSSSTVGKATVVTFDNKIVLDLCSYFKTFANYGLPSFKLDDVARVNLKGEAAKLPVKSTGIWSWYRCCSAVSRELFHADDAAECFRRLKPDVDCSEFGTFRTYLDYCLQDSELVYRLFEKEHVLSFLVERANFAALNTVEALHLGNSRYLLELFKTYGFRLGYFVNPRFFFQHDAAFLIPKGQKTYQGALNYCVPASKYEDVSVLDFASMYPSALASSNLCYGTTTVMKREEWLSSCESLTAIPYRQHSDSDFETRTDHSSSSSSETTPFAYPPVKDEDELVIVINSEVEAFLPEIVRHFVQLRRHHQREHERTRDVYHYNVQLGIKILINSLYGVMASQDSPLAYIFIAVAIVTLSRYQLLGSHRYLTSRGHHVCYADTDSLMVHRWPYDHCDPVNSFLASLPDVELKFEQRMKRFLVLSKKRYVYETMEGKMGIKGFQKKINGLIKFMTDALLTPIWRDLFRDSRPTCSQGWVLWVETLLEAQYRCRNPRKYSIYRKIKPLEEYKSKSHPSVKYILKYPDKADEYVEYTYSQVDVAAADGSKWVVDVQDCEKVNFEQLFKSQKKIFCTLLNIAYWNDVRNAMFMADMVLNAMHWKRFVNAELLHKHSTGKKFMLFVENGVKYTFTINDHLTVTNNRGRKRTDCRLADAEIKSLMSFAEACRDVEMFESLASSEGEDEYY